MDNNNMKIQLFNVMASVDANGNVKVDHSTREFVEQEPKEFAPHLIASKAQEISAFNKSEEEMIRQMGEGTYKIELKLIV